MYDSLRMCEMSGAEAPRQAIAIVGIGNLLLSDDGVGIHAIRSLRTNTRLARLARLIDGGTIGSDLLADVCGCEMLLVLDAVDAGLEPGSVVWMDWNQPEPPAFRARNAHQSGIPDLLGDLRLMDCAPRQAVLIGVQPATVKIGTQLSVAVANALPALEKEVLRQLEQWTAKTESAVTGLHSAGPPDNPR